MVRKLSSLGIPLLLLVLGAVLSFRSDEVDGGEPPSASSANSHFSILGSSSCASSGCHGGGKPRNLGSEWNTWIDSDPHAKAYRILFNETSVRMARNLNLRDSQNRIVPAHENMTCLKCHSPQATESSAHADGVGCESCHGPAGKYGTVHYLDFWKNLTVEEKAKQYGLLATKNIDFRIQQCATCHVGNAEQDVDHNLIAAGHPRLLFEYSSFQHSPNYTPHWKEKTSNFEIRSWILGQIAIAKATLELTEARALKKTNWPEFGEFNCQSCHHKIDDANFASISKSTGMSPWNDWAFAMLPVIGTALSTKSEQLPELKSLEQLRKTMNEKPTDTQTILALTPQALQELECWSRILTAANSVRLENLPALKSAIAADILNADSRTLRLTRLGEPDATLPGSGSVAIRFRAKAQSRVERSIRENS